MTSKERAELRAKANPLEPIFQIGKEGISENLIAQLDDALDVRELLKVRIHLETAPKAPKEFAQELGNALGAEVIQVIVRGECHGHIGFERDGNEGFGYDPLFIINGRAFGRYTAEEKDEISHRGKALRLLTKELEKII